MSDLSEASFGDAEEVDSRPGDEALSRHLVDKEADDNRRRKWLFYLAFWSVIVLSALSFLLVVVSMLTDTHVEGYVIVAFITGAVAQSYILISVITRSLYPDLPRLQLPRRSPKQ